jgi:hypothetical protein
MLLFGEQVRVSIPDFLRFGDEMPAMPLPGSVRTLLPRYVLYGSFATSWQTVCEVVASHRVKVRVYLEALLGGSGEEVQEVLGRAVKLASVVSEEGEKVDEPFPFLLVSHLIDTSANSMEATAAAYSWV